MGHAYLVVHNGGHRGSEDERRGYTQITQVTTYVFTEIISENISLSYRNIFQPPEQFKMPNSKKPRSVNRLHSAKPYQRIVSRQGEMIQKNKRYHCFQKTSISQRRTSQMIRRSPTAYESRIYVLTITLRKIFLVFQLGDHWTSPPWYTQTANLGLNPGEDQRIIWLVRCWLIDGMR